ncbi:MAG: lipoate--protein ligase family protein [Phaeodactylibacter sp.]|nr:lipoate--protein ligase family protein [Phaeodactylibacter sp.]MCB9265836.1 lipoate--protein ligase family protein [Lewinellaceae bacterium]MCB9288826.1 lipoate--protein ligase family protein [Lewinellaceae bacterium]
MNSYSENAAGTEATLRLYTYRDYCALVGRFQNIHAELDLEACRQEGFQYNRRLTGGGAIIMGREQLGLCLATANTFGAANTRELYQLFSTPVIKALEHFGIGAQLRGKNDLEVEGKKIAGLGIHVNPHGAIQFHTSLLVGLDIPLMLKVLKIPMQKIGDKAQVNKVAQRITTVSRALGRTLTTGEVRELVKAQFRAHFGVQLENQPLTAGEKAGIEKLTNERYRNEEWIFHNSPQPDMNGMGLKKTPAGLLRTYVALKGETIKSVLITGDFFGQESLFRQIEVNLKWSALDKELVKRKVHQAFVELGHTTPELSADDVNEAIWRAALGAMKEVQFTYKGSCYFPKK